MHKSSLRNMEKFVEKYLDKDKQKSLKIFDIGSFNVNGSYKPFFKNKNWKYIGIDLEAGPNVDIVLSDMYKWREIDSGAANVVISGQAFEHIEYVWVAVMEVSRILKEDGIFCLIVPSTGEEHRYPVDCWRFFGDGLKALAIYTGLEVIETYTCWNDGPIEGEPNDWKDSVLICRKPKQTFMMKLKFKIKRRLQHLILKI